MKTCLSTQSTSLFQEKSHIYRIMSCRVVSCRVVSCRVMSCRVVSCRVMSYRLVSCRVVLYCVVPCRLMSSHVPPIFISPKCLLLQCQSIIMIIKQTKPPLDLDCFNYRLEMKLSGDGSPKKARKPNSVDWNSCKERNRECWNNLTAATTVPFVIIFYIDNQS